MCDNRIGGGRTQAADENNNVCDNKIRGEDSQLVNFFVCSLLANAISFAYTHTHTNGELAKASEQTPESTSEMRNERESRASISVCEETRACPSDIVLGAGRAGWLAGRGHAQGGGADETVRWLARSLAPSNNQQRATPTRESRSLLGVGAAHGFGTRRQAPSRNTDATRLCSSASNLPHEPPSSRPPHRHHHQTSRRRRRLAAHHHHHSPSMRPIVSLGIVHA